MFRIDALGNAVVVITGDDSRVSVLVEAGNDANVAAAATSENNNGPDPRRRLRQRCPVARQIRIANPAGEFRGDHRHELGAPQTAPSGRIAAEVRTSLLNQNVRNRLDLRRRHTTLNDAKFLGRMLVEINGAFRPLVRATVIDTADHGFTACRIRNLEVRAEFGGAVRAGAFRGPVMLTVCSMNVRVPAYVLAIPATSFNAGGKKAKEERGETSHEVASRFVEGLRLERVSYGGDVPPCR